MKTPSEGGQGPSKYLILRMQHRALASCSWLCCEKNQSAHTFLLLRTIHTLSVLEKSLEILRTGYLYNCHSNSCTMRVKGREQKGRCAERGTLLLMEDVELFNILVNSLSVTQIICTGLLRVLCVPCCHDNFTYI